MKIKVLASGSSGNCYHLSMPSIPPLLIEAGLPLAEIKKGIGFKLSEVVGCLLSHLHRDHSKSVRELCRAGVNCYMSEGTVSGLSLKHHRVQRIAPLKQISVDGWTVTPVPLVHDSREPLGFVIDANGDRLLYASDTAYIKHRVQGMTHLMIEANYCESILSSNVKEGIIPVVQQQRVLENHMSLETVLEFLEANDLSELREIWLLHLSDRNSNAELFKERVTEVSGCPTYVA